MEHQPQRDLLHAQDIPTADDSAEDDSGSMLTVGLVASHGMPEDIANAIRDGLPDELREQIDDTVHWRVRVVTDPLTGSDVSSSALLDGMAQLSQLDEWDYAIALTDIPVRENNTFILSDARREDKVAWISLSSFAPFWLRRKTRRGILRVVAILHEAPEDVRDRLSKNAHGTLIDSPDTDEQIDMRFQSADRMTTLKVLAGMVYANKPWGILPSLRATAVTTIATGSYGLIFSSMWELGEFASTIRLAGLSIIAIAILSTWIIIAHQLWRPHHGAASKYLTTLFNATTVITVLIGVMIAYALVYLVLLFEAAIIMPPSLLETRLEIPVDFLNFMTAAWATASIATLAGALGAGLENTERVRQATFSWRMQRRYEAYQQEEEAKEDEEQKSNDGQPAK